jgi:ABC-type antimicrobial peptide transport system permease subunit
MQKSNYPARNAIFKLIMNIFLLIFFVIGGGIIGGVFGFFGGLFFSDFKRGLEIQAIEWQLLDSPVRFAKIMGVTEDRIWAQTAQGNLYFRERYCNEYQNCDSLAEASHPWVEAKDGEIDLQYQLWDNKTCSLSDKSGPRTSKEPPEKIITCQQYGFNYYILLEDGTIWHRKLPYPGDGIPGYASIFALIGIISGAIMCGAVFFLSGIGTLKLSGFGRKEAQPGQE